MAITTAKVADRSRVRVGHSLQTLHRCIDEVNLLSPRSI